VVRYFDIATFLQFTFYKFAIASSTRGCMAKLNEIASYD
jgi:hypothetical protein